MSMVLEIKDLYGGYQEGVNILQGLNLAVAKGEAVGIIGLNGSGKSTLGKAIINQIPYRQGSLIFNGQSIEDKTTHDLALMGISLMHQGGIVFPNLSVWQNLSLAWRNKADKAYYEQLEAIIPLLRQPKNYLSRTMADKLSGGQRHELALAMTLARKPELVILDEPSAGLSPKAVEDMYELLDVVHKLLEMSIILIEQNISHALSSCDRCEMLSQGVILHEFMGKDLIISEVEKIMFKI
jgi:ABC-type branched-subunit amino acid transport system ATPase component